MIQMIGIDHTRADIKQRELFSFTKKAAALAMDTVKKEPEISGCVLIATCNRMELYVHGEGEKEPLPLLSILCRIKGVEEEMCRPYFVERMGMDAVRHLFSLAGGLASKIVGEDQILTQVKDAAAFARENYATDTVLEVLFRQAVTAGKKVKTLVPMERANTSAAHLAIQRMQEMGCSMKGKQCLVIGNGMMGKITALALQEAGAKVTVTVRQYKSGIVEIPKGCARIHYGQRYEKLKDCDLVFSATASPNVTLLAEQITQADIHKPMIFVDLAVPRDIDPGIGLLSGMTLYNIDDFSIDHRSKEMEKQYEMAASMLEEAAKEYENWLECRDLLPGIRKISATSAEETVWRLKGKVQQTVPEEKKQKELLEYTAEAAEKVISHLLFALRDELEPETFRKCIEILEENICM